MTDRTAVLLALTSNVIGGSTYFAMKFALAGLPEFSMAFLRSLFGFLAMLPLLRFADVSALGRLGRREWSLLLLVGSVGYALPIALGNLGLARSTMSNASLLIGVEPLAVTLMSAFLLAERIRPIRAAALALGITGATVLVADGIPFVSRTYSPHLSGDLLLVAHAVAWAVYSVAAKPLLVTVSPAVITAVALAVSVPCLAPFAIAELPRLRTESPAFLPALAWTAGLGVIASAWAAWIWNLALARMDASRMSGFIFVQPVVGLFLGYLFGERLTAWGIAGGLVVLTGVYLLIRSDRPRS